MSNERKLSEAARTVVDTFRSMVSPLTDEQRHEVFEELNLILAKELTTQDREIDTLKEEVVSLKRFNDQRHEQVWTALEMLKARPNETLVMSLRRHIDHPCVAGMHQYPPGETICTCGRTTI